MKTNSLILYWSIYFLISYSFNSIYGQTPISYGDNIDSVFLNPADVHIYTFSAEMEDIVIIRGSAPGFLDSKIELLGLSAEILEYDIGYVGSEARIDFDVAESGIYTILIQDNGNDNFGEYIFSLQKSFCPSINTSFVCTMAFNDNLPQQSAMNAYVFEVDQSGLFRIIMSAPNFLDPQFELYNKNGFIGGAVGYVGGPTQLDTTLSAGSYTLLAMDVGADNSGEYDLSINAITGTCTSPTCSSAQQEICNNNLDDDGDLQIDCEDPDCIPNIISVDTLNPTAPNFNNGQIVIQASGFNLEYSIYGDSAYQTNNTFDGLVEGSYNVNVRNSVIGCFAEYGMNPVILGNSPCTFPSFTWLTQAQNFCDPTSLTLEATDADPNFNYQLVKNNLEIGNPISSTGGDLIFEEIFIEESSTFSVRAILNSEPTCSFDFMDSELEIKIEKFNFSVSEVKAESGTDNNGRINFCLENGMPPYMVTYEPQRGIISSSLDPDCAESFAIEEIKAGFYSINAVDATGCTGNLVVEVPNPDKRRIGFPEKPLLTPNSDGINDELIYDGLFRDPEMNELIVYDRYGSIILNEKPYLNNWDGTFNGKPVPDGTYFYTLRVFGENEDVFHGFITLIR